MGAWFLSNKPAAPPDNGRAGADRRFKGGAKWRFEYRESMRSDSDRLLAGSLSLASESLMARLFTHHTAWERLITIGLLGITGVALGGLSAAVLGVVVRLVVVTALGVETVRHRDALRQLR